MNTALDRVIPAPALDEVDDPRTAAAVTGAALDDDARAERLEAVAALSA